MRIIDIHIGCFGGLKNFKLKFEDGFQIIYGENGYGKSTVMSFIKLMLYGKNSKSRDLNQNIRKKYTPFDGSKMNGSVRCEIDDHIIRVEKEFGKTQANDRIYVFDESMGTEVSVPAGMEIGEYLLNIDERTFERVIFGGNADGDMGSIKGADEIMSKLVNVGTSGDEDISLYNIIEDLNMCMEKIKSKRGIAGSIPYINEELFRLKEEKSNLIQRKKELEQISKTDITMMNKEKVILRKLIKRIEDDKRILEKQRTGKNGENKREGLTVNKGKQMMHRLSAGICFILGVLLLANKNGIAGTSVYGMLGAIILLTAGFVLLIGSGRKRCSSEIINDNETFSEKISEFMEDLGYNGYSLEDLKARARELEYSDKSDTSEFIQRIDREIEECKYNIARTHEKWEELIEEYEAYKIAVSVMRDCAAEIRSIVSEPLNHMAGVIFSNLTDDRYDGFIVDEQYQIRVREKNEALYREWKTLSLGTANQAYLSLRIAVNEMFSGQEKMPLILDDVLANYDEKRAKQAIRILKERDRQVILFTCHQGFE